ncbi:MAG TPA: hypothetical protein VMY78_16145 [Solirubrobacteraceae bacterium]|nr:hypothetical protein [Solirubrobacteraceae bacterium]
MNTLGRVLDEQGEPVQSQNYAIAMDFIAQLLADLRAGESRGWHGLLLEWPQDDEPAGFDGDGRALYGPEIADAYPDVGRGITGRRADGTRQWLFAVDGQRFGPGDDDVPLGPDALCLLRRTRRPASGRRSRSSSSGRTARAGPSTPM